MPDEMNVRVTLLEREFTNMGGKLDDLMGKLDEKSKDDQDRHEEVIQRLTKVETKIGNGNKHNNKLKNITIFGGGGAGIAALLAWIVDLVRG